MPNHTPMLNVRLLADTRHGAKGECVWLPVEYAEAVIGDNKGELVNSKSLTRSNVKYVGGTAPRRKGKAWPLN